METLDLHGVFRDDRAIYRTVQQALFRCSATGVAACWRSSPAAAPAR